MHVRFALLIGLAGSLGAALSSAPARATAAAGPVGSSVSAGMSGSLLRVASCDGSGRIFLWDESGMLAPGWPVAASGAWPIGTPRLQDLDGDGQPEVVCLLKSWAGGRSVRAWRLDGQPFAGREPLACPADMADTPEQAEMDGDGVLEWVWPIEGGGVGLSAAWDPAHQKHGFPMTVASGRLRLRLVDVDGDGAPDVVGGVDEGAAGRWFVIYLFATPPIVMPGTTAAPVTDAPILARPVGGGSWQMFVPMCGQLGRCDSDGLLGFHPAPGWPVADGSGPTGPPALLADAARPLLTRGRAGRLAAFSRSGQPLRVWTTAVQLGQPVTYADLPAGASGGGWVQHPGGATLRFQSEAGCDSAGRPRLFTRELGSRHHGANTSAPAGLLPPVRFRIWLNGAPAAEVGAPVRLAASDVEVRGAREATGADAGVEARLVVSRGAAVMGQTSGRDALRLQLHLSAGLYGAAVMSGADTLASARFDVEPELALWDVYSYPNPSPAAMDFLFALSRPAHVSVEVFTVAGRRVRSLEGDFGEGRQRLGWDGRDAAGRPAANGVYLYRVEARSSGERCRFIGKLIRMS